MLATIATDVSEMTSDLVALRHRLHQIPEVGLHLPQTGDAIRSVIAAAGLEVHEARSVTGFMAVIRGGQAPADLADRPIVLLRADMDALPITEATDLPWRSTNGAMHACGHDLHMAGLVGAMRVLARHAERLRGDVVCMFQPGEEGCDGAQHMIDEGLLEAAGRLPDHAYGLHVWSGRYPAGFIGTRPGPMMASSDTLSITIQGRGGHGSAPHETLDPIPVAAELITQAQVMIARAFNAFDPVVATCGRIAGGTAPNVIPDTVTCDYTLRAFSPEARARLIERLSDLARGIAAAHSMSARCDLTPLYPVTVNDEAEYAFVREVVEGLWPGRWAEQDTPMAAAEDFAKVLNRIPGCFVGVCAVPEGVDAAGQAFNHSAKAVFTDAAVPECARLLASLAAARLT